MKVDFERVKNIFSLDSELNKIQDVDILMERILTEARQVVQADAGSIYIRDKDKLVINYAQNDTLSKKLLPGQKLIYNIFQIPINKKTISGWVATTGEPLNIPDVYQIPSENSYNYDTGYDQISGYTSCSMLTIPLKTNTGEILGVLQVINKLDKAGNTVSFNEEDELLVMHFANNATVVLQRAQMTRALLLRMINMAELRDPKETGAHVNRVAGYAVLMYDRWAYRHDVPAKDREKYRDILRMAAMLHDVGKVGISDVILKKPGRFTDEEYEIMKRHTWVGAKLFLYEQSEFDELAREVAFTHHENWDGSGYPGHIDVNDGTPIKVDAQKRPRGKKGSEIPVFGRIVAVADVYDALCSKRVYKDAWDETKVLEEMHKMSGNKFDPEILDIFTEVYENIRTVREKYAEEE